MKTKPFLEFLPFDIREQVIQSTRSIKNRDINYYSSQMSYILRKKISVIDVIDTHKNTHAYIGSPTGIVAQVQPPLSQRQADWGVYEANYREGNLIRPMRHEYSNPLEKDKKYDLAYIDYEVLKFFEDNLVEVKKVTYNILSESEDIDSDKVHTLYVAILCDVKGKPRLSIEDSKMKAYEAVRRHYHTLEYDFVGREDHENIGRMTSEYKSMTANGQKIKGLGWNKKRNKWRARWTEDGVRKELLFDDRLKAIEHLEDKQR